MPLAALYRMEELFPDEPELLPELELLEPPELPELPEAPELPPEPVLPDFVFAVPLEAPVAPDLP